MLVCNISLRPARRAIAATVAEAAAASDASTTGQVVFATLVDDPASVNDLVDAYLGDIMVEAASATDNVTAGSAFVAAIDEAVTADSQQSSTLGVTYASWNPGDAVAMSLSGGNLTATSTAASAAIRANTSKTSGKYYFEITMATWAGTNTAIGIALSTVTLPFFTSTPGTALTTKSGAGYSNGSSIGGFNLGLRSSGNIIGIAVDLTAGLIWFRVAPTGNWNGNATANPATGTGGASLGAMTGGVFFPAFNVAASGEVATANFGASAFSGAVPSGFTAGFPA